MTMAPVQSIGPTLRERREAMGVTLAEAEVATRIRQKYLAALESDEWDLLPGEVVGRGFLRNYTTYLGLDANEMIERRRAMADDSLATVLVNTSAGTQLPPERQVDYRPKDVALREESDELDAPRQLNLTPVFAFLIIAALVVVAWWGVTQLGPQMDDLIAQAQRQLAEWQAPAVAPIAATTDTPDTDLPNSLVAPTVEVEPTLVVEIGGEGANVGAITEPVATEEIVAPLPAVSTDQQPGEAEVAPEEPPSLIGLLPTPTPQPPAPAPELVSPVTNTAADLRGGPSTDYPLVGGLQEGQLLNIAGQSADGAWYQLSDSSWIFAQLVNNQPTGLPVLEAPPLPAPGEQQP